MPHTYVYKLIVDDGGAPCVGDGLLTLAICKPIIRRLSKPGSWIFGFAGNTMAPSYKDNSLIYLAQVSCQLPGTEYFAEEGPYRSRLDCIYVHDRTRNAYKQRPGALYHVGAENLKHDLGEPPSFDKAFVLISESFRYFGREGLTAKELGLSELTRLLERMYQGHRVNLTSKILDELEVLRKASFASSLSLTASPFPTYSKNRSLCARDCEADPVSDDDRC